MHYPFCVSDKLSPLCLPIHIWCKSENTFHFKTEVCYEVTMKRAHDMFILVIFSKVIQYAAFLQCSTHVISHDPALGSVFWRQFHVPPLVQFFLCQIVFFMKNSFHKPSVSLSPAAALSTTLFVSLTEVFTNCFRFAHLHDAE